MAAPIIQFKRGVLADLPGLRAGEPGFTTDSYELYVGIDSTTTNNQFLGSSRFWNKGSASTGSGVKLVEGTSNGTQFLELQSPASISGISTYVMPASGTANQILTVSSVTGGVHTLAFSDPSSSSFTLAADSGSNDTFTTSETLTFAGTSNEIDTTVSDNTITIGLPNTVNITTALDVPTVEATNLKARDGTSAITISDSTGAVQCSQNLTVTGNLIVNGSTTQVNTTQTTIEDQLLELGMVDGSAPSSDLNKDIGILFNYYTDAAKKAGIYWDDSTSRIVVSNVATESTGVMTNATSGVLEIGSLFVNDCAGTTQVINCSGTTRTLENITIDGGSF